MASGTAFQPLIGLFLDLGHAALQRSQLSCVLAVLPIGSGLALLVALAVKEPSRRGQAEATRQ